MRNLFFTFLILVSSLVARGNLDTAKPWTWWWILGNSMTKRDITEQLEYMNKAGIGGVCLIPIYGERGDEMNFINLL